MSEERSTGMGRRQLLELGIAGGTLAAASSCSLVGALGPSDLLGDDRALGEAEIRQFVGRLDSGLEVIAKGPSLSHLIPGSGQASPAWHARAREMDGLGRKALGALTFTGMYRCLPPESRQHPEVRRRLDAMMPELDEAVFGTTAALAATDTAERAALQAHLKVDPDLPLRLYSLFDAPARELGVPRESRQQMRRILGNVGWRLRKQSPSLLIDEYVAKVEKAAAHHGQTEQLKRYLATAAFESALWRDQATSLITSPGAVAARDPGPPSRARPPTARRSPLEPEKPALVQEGRMVTAGCWLLGIGAMTLGAGAAAIFGGGLFTGAVIMTAGGIILLVGIITALAGGIRRIKNK